MRANNNFSKICTIPPGIPQGSALGPILYTLFTYDLPTMCETTVNYVISEWKAVENDKRLIALFLDFKRAFEAIDREYWINYISME